MKRDEDGAIVGAFDLFWSDGKGGPWVYVRTEHECTDHEAALNQVDLAGGDEPGRWGAWRSYGPENVVIPAVAEEDEGR